MEFSIILPVPSAEADAKKAIDSVLSQTYTGFELIVVQYASPSPHLRIPSGYGRKVRLLVEDTASPEEAKNTGAAQAAGKYLIFLDPYDILLPWALEVYSEVINKADRPPLIAGKVVREDFNYSASSYEGHPEYVFAEDYLSKDREVHLTQSVIVIKKEEYIRSGGFTVGTFPVDDLDLFLKIGCLGPAALITNPYTIVYRYHKAGNREQISNLVNKLKTVINIETAHSYPGGNLRRLQRYALIGGPVFNWVKKNIILGNYRLAFSLAKKGFPMMAAGGYKKILNKVKGGNKPVSLVPKDPKYRSAV